jgi:hypothetical protein
VRHLLKLAKNDCRWVEGEPRDQMFCGEPKVPGTSYCAVHTKMAFAQDQRKRQYERLPIRLPVDTIPHDAPPELETPAVPQPELEEIMMESE